MTFNIPFYYNETESSQLKNVINRYNEGLITLAECIEVMDRIEYGVTKRRSAGF